MNLTASNFDPVRYETGKPLLLAGLRQRHGLADAASGIAEQWLRFRAWNEIPGRIGTHCYGVICGHDAGNLEYLCGVEVVSFDGLPEGIGRIRVPAQHYAVFLHRGPASGLQSSWAQILEWLASGEFESAHMPDFEVYPPRYDPLADDGEVEVWVGVISRAAPGQGT
jgi:AraC family transcriptional regulator